MDWILANWGIILTIAGALVTIGLVVSKLTPNKVDDAIFGFLRGLLGATKDSDAGGTSAPLTRDGDDDGSDLFSPRPDRADRDK